MTKGRGAARRRSACGRGCAWRADQRGVSGWVAKRAVATSKKRTDTGHRSTAACCAAGLVGRQSALVPTGGSRSRAVSATGRLRRATRRCVPLRVAATRRADAARVNLERVAACAWPHTSMQGRRRKRTRGAGRSVAWTPSSIQSSSEGRCSPTSTPEANRCRVAAYLIRWRGRDPKPRWSEQGRRSPHSFPLRIGSEVRGKSDPVASAAS